MANEQVQEAPQGKKKFLLIGVIALVVLLAGGAGAYFLLAPDSGADSGQSANHQSATNAAPVAYVNIAQPFVFNVTGDKRNRLVQIKVQLMVRGSENENLAKYHSPLIESSLLSTFASATVDQLRSVNGRVELRDKASEDIKASLIRAVGEPVIERVLFTDFVIQ
ncbi:flagellar basal body-associated protein FliL [Vibrio sp.]|uniref:flagellar basal body-associated protein FliL n=1 Tax=Vibrio sp. TaxID=678 RepID=UPI003D106792